MASDFELDDLGPGTMFRLRFLGSVAVDEDEGASQRKQKKEMVEEAVLKMKVLTRLGKGPVSSSSHTKLILLCFFFFVDV